MYSHIAFLWVVTSSFILAKAKYENKCISGNGSENFR